MNIHIELLKKWLADKDSVSQQELNDNRAAAYGAAYDAATDAAYDAATNAAYAAYSAAYSAAYAAAATDAAYWADKATYWVEQYEELTK